MGVHAGAHGVLTRALTWALTRALTEVLTLALTWGLTRLLTLVLRWALTQALKWALTRAIRILVDHKLPDKFIGWVLTCQSVVVCDKNFGQS